MSDSLTVTIEPIELVWLLLASVALTMASIWLLLYWCDWNVARESQNKDQRRIAIRTLRWGLQHWLIDAWMVLAAIRTLIGGPTDPIIWAFILRLSAVFVLAWKIGNHAADFWDRYELLGPRRGEGL